MIPNFNQAISLEKPYTYNNKSKRKTSQAFSSYDVEHNARHLKPGRSIILNYFFKLSNEYPKVIASQTTIAERCDLSRKTVNKYLQELRGLGLIVYEGEFWCAKEYFLNELFFDYIFRKKLGDQYPLLRRPLKHLRQSALSSSEAFTRDFKKKKVTQYKYNKLLPFGNNNLLIYNQQKEDSYSIKDIHLRESSRKSAYNSMTKSKTMAPTEEKEEIRISALVAGIAKTMNLTEEQEIKLSVYPDIIVKKAYQRIQGKQLAQPFNYMFKICSEESSKPAAVKQNIVRMTDNKPAQDNPMAVRDERFQYRPIKLKSDEPHTALQIANEIKKISIMEIPKTGFSIDGLRDRLIANWCDRNFVPVGDESEAIALLYINSFRTKFDLPPRTIAKSKPETIVLKEIVKDNTIYRKVVSKTTETKFDDVYPPLRNPFDFEEMYE